MTGTRMPSWRERENNKKRERRRRAIAAKIYTGLRMYGNYKLPKHCDNNEVLKALAREAGWIVEEDGTTYRKGCKPMEPMDIMGGSASVSPCSSYPVSPRAGASYNPSPASSSFPSPTRSISAPVTPPLSSPTCRTPRNKNNNDWDDNHVAPPWANPQNYSLPSSTPQSPGRQPLPEPGWLASLQIPHGAPTSPTFSLVSSNPFASREEVMMAGGGSRMWTPGQSGTCSPIVATGSDRTADVPMADGMAAEFAFGNGTTGGLVKAWEGEIIHEECVPDDLELTLGSSRTR
ncbi:BES1/BZR1-like protein 4 [Bienertia sinuspersici]